MNALGRFWFEDNWNGGRSTIAGRPLPYFKDRIKEVKIGKNRYPARFGKRYGKDYDHGKVYGWEASDIIVELPCPIFKKREISLVEIFTKSRFKVILVFGD